MGRPINKKFFANTNSPYQDQATGGSTGQGGELVADPVLVANSGTNYSTGATVLFSAPQLPGGVRATGTATIPATGGGITNVTLTNPGSGYTSTATVSVVKPASVTVLSTLSTTTSTITGINTAGIFVGMRMDGSPGMPVSNFVTAVGATSVTGTFNFTSNTTTNVTFSDQGTGAAFATALTNTQQNGIAVYAFIPGGSSGVLGDIMKQEASRRYLVKTAQGQGQCKLVTTSTLAEGEMYMTAVDVTGASYFVGKLTARRALVYRYLDNGGTFELDDGQVSGWSLSAATTGTIQIVNN